MLYWPSGRTFPVLATQILADTATPSELMRASSASAESIDGCFDIAARL